MKLACRTTEPYQPYVPHSYDNENDFGFGNMQVPEEENYDNDKETYDILKPCIYKKR